MVVWFTLGRPRRRLLAEDRRAATRKEAHYKDTEHRGFCDDNELKTKVCSFEKAWSVWRW